MTLSDVMALIAGVASVLAHRPGGGGMMFVPLGWIMLVITMAWFLWVGAGAFSAVILVRLIRYRRAARPAEWLSILTLLIGLQFLGPSTPIDGWIEKIPPDSFLQADSIEAARWRAAGLILGVVLTVLGFLRLGRSKLPHWLRAVIFVGLIELMLIGPIEVMGLQAPVWLAPAMGFGLGSGSMLLWLTCQLVGLIPLGLLLGVPAVGALIERFQRLPWRWTEWAGFSLFSTMGLTLMPLYRGNFSTFSPGWFAERVIVGGWLIIVGSGSWWIVVKLVPWWSRWQGDQSFSSIAEVSARTP